MKNAESKVPEIEITDGMIRAGARELRECELSELASGWSSVDVAVRRVFSVMQRERQVNRRGGQQYR